MTAAERLVTQIRDFVNGFDQEATPEAHELAAQFADLCQSLNVRLAKCADFLRKGMRSEAVQEALSSPSIFELAEILNFEERKSWLNLCLDLGMTPAVEVDPAAIDTLQKECTTEQLLEPLLREFRRMVHTGSRDERIRILRRLRRHDPDNPIWRQNLEPLEQEQLGELSHLAAKAMAAGNVDAVLDLYAEMTASHRVVDVPAVAVDEIEGWLRRRREKAALEEGARLAEQLDAALEQRDYQALGALLPTWARLAKYPDFKPTPAILDSAAKANQWHEEETRRRQRDRDFQESIQALQLELRNPQPELAGLEAKWRHLIGFDHELPPDLNREVTTTLDRLRTTEQRRRRRRTTMLTTGTLLTVAIIAGAGLFGYRQFRIAKTTDDMAGLWNQQRHADLNTYLNRLEKMPWLYEGAKAAFYRTRVDELLAQESRRLDDLAKRWQALAQVQAQGFAVGPETIVALLAEARSLATADEEKLRVDNWERTWRSWQRDQQTRRDAEFVAQLDDFDRQLAAARALRGGLDLRLAELERLRQQLNSTAATTTGVSAPLRDRLGELRQALDTWGGELDKQQAAEQEERRNYARLLDRIPATAGDLAAWETAVDEFVKTFPNAPETGDLRQALAQLPAARDAIALATFELKAFPASDDEGKALQTLIRTLPAERASVWQASLQACLLQNAPATRNKMGRRLQELRTLDFFDFGQVKVRRQGNPEWTTLYLPGPFHMKQVEDTDHLQYWGHVYGLEPEALTAATKFFSITTDQFEVDYPGEEKSLFPPAQYLRQFFTQLPREAVLEHLLKELEQLRRRTDLPVIPKAAIMRILGAAIADGAPLPGLGLEAYGSLFAGLNLQLPWYNRANPLVLEAEAEIGRRLAAMPNPDDLLRNLRFSQELLLAAVNRRVHCVGLAWRAADGGQLEPVLARPGGQTLWIVLPGQGGVPNQFFEVAVADQDGRFQLATAGGGRVVPGQLLFAPADRRPAAETLRQMAPPAQRNAVNWPPAWPVNARELP